jgi:hypothetical protein
MLATSDKSRDSGGMYVPTEPGYSRDKDKLESVMRTWDWLAPAVPELTQ